MGLDESLYDEKLAWFKTNERPEAVLVVADDADLMRLVVAWSTIAVEREAPVAKPPTGTEHEWWEWLWKNTRYSRTEIAERTGIRGESLERGMLVLTGNRVLYPDGTVNSFVQRYLREKVLKLFGSKPRKTAKAS
ncbi:MAG: hypothetical protein ACYTAN_17770 [Planctomycetota bacterium]|jgi:hypothetical protein